jgi:nicotinate-nucleotide adenylyltransferase
METDKLRVNRRLGVFGGTFDPPHIGHLTVTKQLLEANSLDEVIWVPVSHPPHKLNTDVTPPGLRLEMVKAATEGFDGHVVNDIEIVRGGPSYTVDTLRNLCLEYPEADILLILGADQFSEFSKWKDPEEIARLASLWVLTREGQDPRYIDPGVDVEWTSIQIARIDVSSSEVRRCIREGEPFRHFLSNKVAEIIVREELYLY